MAKTKPRKYETVSGGGSISEHASDWIRLFIKHFELNLLDTGRSLPSDASDLDYRAERRHSPSGYASYERYRPWLRDEFDFRCVYCLKRETRGQVTGEFDLDHFEPQSLNPRRQLDYLNLVYACRRCNSVKRDQTVGNPFDLLHSDNIVTRPGGSLHASDHESLRLIRQLDLNSPRLKHWRGT
jgi:5-methylcytosine-specific restriction endonuclease McrA